MKHKIKLITISLHISAAIYVLVGLLLIIGINFNGGAVKILMPYALTILAAFIIVFAVFIEFVVRGLAQRKMWAWWAALIISATYLATFFLPLGALGLWGLLDKGSRAEFDTHNVPRRQTATQETATLKITRVSEYASKFRAYLVVLDGNKIGKLRDGETKEFPISEGKHHLSLKIDWCGSNTCHFTIAENKTLRFQVRSNVTGAKSLMAIYYIFCERNSLLHLEQVADPTEKS